ncbi:MAG TPA: phosphate ABC transporter permease, partial [Methanoculleus sp.]|nr:phosphate ABC transporter permease [Methanoculleus sp.]
MKKEEPAAVRSGYPGWSGHSWTWSELPSTGTKRHIIDLIISKLLFIVALFAILIVFFIIGFLLRDGYQIVL